VPIPERHRILQLQAKHNLGSTPTQNSREDEMKPGWKTTEFWNTLITHVISLATLFGVIKQGPSPFLQDTIAQSIAAAVVVASNCLLAWKYIHDRTGLKTEERKNVE
jgi:hypothetical protein